MVVLVLEEEEEGGKSRPNPSIWSSDSGCTGQTHAPEAERRALSPGCTVTERPPEGGGEGGGGGGGGRGSGRAQVEGLHFKQTA